MTTILDIYFGGRVVRRIALEVHPKGEHNRDLAIHRAVERYHQGFCPFDRSWDGWAEVGRLGVPSTLTIQ
jgi:hypothetical protein